MKKIYSILNLKKFLKNKKKNKKIVLCHGVFDLLHIGHIEHFNEAKSYADILIVSVTSDRFVGKGPGRPSFKLQERMKSISSLNIVDYVVESDSASAENIIKNIKPNFYIKGSDYKNLSDDISKKIINEKKAVEEYGGKIIFTKTALNSSTELLFKNNMIFSDQITKYFKKISNKFSLLDLKKILLKIKKLKVLVIGETIIDKYSFCETIGKASKDPMLVIKENNSKIFLGGAASIAQNTSKLCDNVTFFSKLGLKNNYINHIKKKLKDINFKYIKAKGYSTIEKKRYVDELSNTKILGIYDTDQGQTQRSDYKTFCKFIKNINNYDIIIVADYGHGLLNNETVKKILKKKKNIFLNCQINANSRGSHSILKYKGVESLIINETELRYEMRDSITYIEKLVKVFSKKYKINNVIVTKGQSGVLMYRNKINKLIKVPGIANNVIDKVGTGDIMLSIISLFFAVGKKDEISLIAGSMFGAKTLEKYGNENVVEAQELNKFFSTFLR